MKLPIPFLLYTSSLALAGFTGWQVYELLPLQSREAKNEAMQRGQKAAIDLLTVGKGKGPISVDWRYARENRDWWENFKNANFLGKLPPPPEDPKGPNGGEEPPPPPPPVTPLEDIFELALLVYDGRDEGKGALSHVVVRYKPECGVQPPDWYVRENQPVAGSFGGPRDGVPPPRAGGNPNFRGKTEPREPTPTPAAMPTATAGPELLLQKVWIQGGDDPRRDPHLWPPFQHIRLVRVDASAQSAYFVREAPKPKNGEQPVPEVEEQLFKTAANVSQEVLRELSRLEGGEALLQSSGAAASSAAANTWLNEPDTRVIGDNRWNVGSKDHQAFQAEEDFFDKLYVDTYVSKLSDRRGLIVRNVDPQLATKFGVTQGDVLLSVNNRPVKTKAAAVQFGKQEYEKGVRTFTTVWLSGGQEIERVYQLPDK